MTQRRADATTAPGRRPRRPPGPGPREIAAYQAMVRNWLLIWSTWRRTWTAIACFGPEPLIIDNPNPHELLEQCQAAETTAARRWSARIA